MSLINVNLMADSQGGSVAPISSVMRNRIINGAMVIDQRNAGASVTANDGTFGVDRWVCAATANGKFTMQQNAGSITPPAGFNYYLGCTSTAVTSLGATDFYHLRQKIEGFNFADLGWGTANAQTITFSFWVRSSLIGTFGGSLNNSAFSRSYPFSYIITAANTWEQKSITIAGDTSGTWVGATNGTGLQVSFSLGSGSTYSGTAGAWSGSLFTSATGATSVVGTNGATFYITGVQLEKGTQATGFEYRQYGTELALCQRYYYKINSTSNAYGLLVPVAYVLSGTTLNVVASIPVPLRAPISSIESASTTWRISGGTITSLSNYVVDTATSTTQSALISATLASSQTAGAMGSIIQNNSTSGFIAFPAEL